MTPFLFFLFSASPAIASDVCRGADVQVDRVSGVRSTALDVPRLGLTLAVADEVATMSAPIRLSGLIDNAVPPATEILMVLDDGTKVTFRTSDSATPSATLNTAGGFTSWTLTWSVTSEAAHAVAGARPVALRYSIADHPIAVDYSNAVGTKVQRMYACAANQLASE